MVKVGIIALSQEEVSAFSLVEQGIRDPFRFWQKVFEVRRLPLPGIKGVYTTNRIKRNEFMYVYSTNMKCPKKPEEVAPWVGR